MFRQVYWQVLLRVNTCIGKMVHQIISAVSAMSIFLHLSLFQEQMSILQIPTERGRMALHFSYRESDQMLPFLQVM